MCNEDACSRCPPGKAAIWTPAACYSQASAYPVYGAGACIKHSPGMACNESLIPKLIAKSRFPTPWQRTGLQHFPILSHQPRVYTRAKTQGPGNQAHWLASHPASICRGAARFQVLRMPKWTRLKSSLPGIQSWTLSDQNFHYTALQVTGACDIQWAWRKINIKRHKHPAPEQAATLFPWLEQKTDTSQQYWAISRRVTNIY